MKKVSKNDWIQITLNLISFLVLISAPAGIGSFWAFSTFFFLTGRVLLEILLSSDKTALWVWITKAFTYFLLVWKFSSNIGPFHWEYVMMIAISLCTLFISRKVTKNRAIAMWGTNIAYAIGGVMYIIVIVNKPEDYGIHHIAFWLINCLSYAILIWQIIKEKRDRVNLIIPIYAVISSLGYVVVILVT